MSPIRACDRHARFEGSLKAAPKRFVLLNDEDLDEMGQPKRMLEQQLCDGCVDEIVEFYRETPPKTALLFEVPELTEDEKERLKLREREIFEKGVEAH